MPTFGNFNRRQVFFDLDDTLIDDGYKFEITSCDCAKAIIVGFETEGPSIDEIITTFRRIDTERVHSVPPTERFIPSRFQNSWHITYDALCEKYKRPAKRSVYAMLNALTAQNFEPPYFIVPGAIDTLTALVHSGKYDLHILSAGDPILQGRKTDLTDLEKHFASVHFVPDGDKAPILEQAAKEFGPDTVWMIGNSIHSDINAALRARVHALYIQRGSWALWKAEPLNQRFITLESIRDVPSALENWKS